MNPAALNPLANNDLANFVVAATPGGIEAQEAQGQRELCAAAKLPRDGTEQQENRRILESFGIVFGSVADDLFINVTLPTGWQVKPTDHSMHNDLLDEKGRKRAAIFYKAAFYDHSARLTLCCRFSSSTQPVGGWENYGRRDGTQAFEGVVMDGTQVIFTTPPTRIEPAYSQENRSDWLAYMKEKEARQSDAHAWLDANYPDWQNPTAYWE